MHKDAFMDGLTEGRTDRCHADCYIPEPIGHGIKMGSEFFHFWVDFFQNKYDVQESKQKPQKFSTLYKMAANSFRYIQSLKIWRLWVRCWWVKNTHIVLRLRPAYTSVCSCKCVESWLIQQMTNWSYFSYFFPRKLALIFYATYLLRHEISKSIFWEK